MRVMQQDPAAAVARTWALVPIRGLETAKSRLGADLDPVQRVALVRELLRRTLVATQGARRIEGTIVVTMDPAAAAIASEVGAVGLVERAPGLNGAIAGARSVAVARGATAVIVLPADLPDVTARAIDEFVDEALVAAGGTPAAAGGAPATARSRRRIVAMVPDRHGRGTNALLLVPPDAIDPAFGIGSRAAHRAAAAAADAAFVEVGGPLSFDLDTPADLAIAAAGLEERDA